MNFVQTVPKRWQKAISMNLEMSVKYILHNKTTQLWLIYLITVKGNHVEKIKYIQIILCFPVSEILQRIVLNVVKT
jgi:hypothetical protein